MLPGGQGGCEIPDVIAKEDFSGKCPHFFSRHGKPARTRDHPGFLKILNPGSSELSGRLPERPELKEPFRHDGGSLCFLKVILLLRGVKAFGNAIKIPPRSYPFRIYPQRTVRDSQKNQISGMSKAEAGETRIPEVRFSQRLCHDFREIRKGLSHSSFKILPGQRAIFLKFRRSEDPESLPKGQDGCVMGILVPRAAETSGHGLRAARNHG